MNPEDMKEIAKILRECGSRDMSERAEQMESMAEQAERDAQRAADCKAHGSESQARAQLASIRRMVWNLDPIECEQCSKWHRDTGGEACDTLETEYESHDTEDDAREAAQQTIQEDALSVEVRSDWHAPGSNHDAEGEGSEPVEYIIVLCTGGPACRIIGDLENGEPSTARIEHQDWGTPWTDYRLDSDEEADVLAYAQQFYFGEG